MRSASIATDSARTRQPHHVYVVELDRNVLESVKVQRQNPERDSEKPCVYVGMTSLTPEQRFENHKAGKKASRFVQKYGLHLLPQLYTHLNPMTRDEAEVTERELAEQLRLAGYTVTGGH